MKDYFNFLMNSLAGGCIILCIGLIILFKEIGGGDAVGAALFIAFAIWIILRQFKKCE